MTRLARQGQEREDRCQELKLRGVGCRRRGERIPRKTDFLLVLWEKKVDGRSRSGSGQWTRRPQRR